MTALTSALLALALSPAVSAVTVDVPPLDPIVIDAEYEGRVGDGYLCATSDPKWNTWGCVLYYDGEAVCVVSEHEDEWWYGGGTSTQCPVTVFTDGAVCSRAEKRGDEWDRRSCTTVP